MRKCFRVQKRIQEMKLRRFMRLTDDQKSARGYFVVWPPEVWNTVPQIGHIKTTDPRWKIEQERYLG